MESGLLFRPDLSPAHLQQFVDRIRAGMPEALWRVIEPWTTKPRRWIDGDNAEDAGEVYGLDIARSGDAVCELHAPIAWHTVITQLRGVVYFRHPGPTCEQLGAMWNQLEADGLRPAVCVTLSPWLSGWARTEVMPASGAWAVDVLGVAASGGCPDRARAAELARVLNGPDADEERCAPHLVPGHGWAYWPTV